MLQLDHAIKDGSLVHISEVPSGLKCSCTCPCCRDSLIAKKGRIKAHHFAHVHDDCGYGVQTALHLMAKDIIAQEKKIMIPPIVLSNFDVKNGPYKPAQLINVDFVEIEKHYDQIVPDIVVTVGRRKLFVEIKVTHGVGETKKRQVEEIGISMMEIDLSSTGRMVSMEELRDIIINKTEGKRWIFNSKEKICKEKLRSLSDRFGIRKKIVEHGCASHVMNCPRGKRNFRGKLYANFSDDCCDCKNRLAVEYVNDTPEGSLNNTLETFIYCGGKYDIETLDSINSLSKL
jgi:hypothetical protein